MGSVDTMKLMGDAFVSLAERFPLEKISVSDIVAASGKNRKTFYYHFNDKSHLIRWIFRNKPAPGTLRGSIPRLRGMRRVHHARPAVLHA